MNCFGIGCSAALALGLCLSLSPSAAAIEKTVYTDEDYRKFDELRGSPFISQKNFLIPERIRQEDKQAFSKKIDHINQIREKIQRGKANEEEIHRYFTFRERILNYRLQLIHQLYADRGGTISRNDPNIDENEIKDPEVKAIYEDYLKARQDNYRSQKAALQAIGAAQEDR